MRDWTWLYIVLLTGLLALSACSSGYQEPGPATVAVQQTRAAGLGTEIARDMQRTATMQALRSAPLATATAQALQETLASAHNWPASLEESFDTIDRWSAGTSEWERADGTWSIVDGRYRWEVTSKMDITWWVYPDQEPVDDFYLSAEVIQLSGPQTAKNGLVFRLVDDSNFYLLEITWAGEAALYMLYQGAWEELIPAWSVEMPTAGEMLKIEIIGRGSDFLFLIGENPPVAYSDNTLGSGITGLSIGLQESGQQAIWEFDNFVIRSP